MRRTWMVPSTTAFFLCASRTAWLIVALLVPGGLCNNPVVKDVGGDADIRNAASFSSP